MKIPNYPVKCQECGLSGDGFFCRLSPEDLNTFESIKIVNKVYPKGATLFVEGQPVDGVYMLCQGTVKLSTCSQYGKVIVIDVAEPGDLLGLSAAVNEDCYETTAEVLETCQVNYVATDDLLHLLRNDPAACFNAVRQLSRNYNAAFRQVCALGLSDSVVGKLAKLFLSWSGNGNGNGNGSDGPVRIKNAFTHAEMAQMIGTSRETVTRALKYFRDNELVTVENSHLVIHDRHRLKTVVR